MKVLSSVLDVTAEFFGPPITTRTDGEAIRIFSDAINDKQTAFNAHPEHYNLYAIGHFDEQSGIIKPISPPQLLIAGINVERR